MGIDLPSDLIARLLNRHVIVVFPIEVNLSQVQSTSRLTAWLLESLVLCCRSCLRLLLRHRLASQFALLEECPSPIECFALGAFVRTALTHESRVGIRSDADPLLKFANLHLAALDEGVDHSPDLIAVLVDDHAVQLRLGFLFILPVRHEVLQELAAWNVAMKVIITNGPFGILIWRQFSQSRSLHLVSPLLCHEVISYHETRLVRGLFGVLLWCHCRLSFANWLRVFRHVQHGIEIRVRRCLRHAVLLSTREQDMG